MRSKIAANKSRVTVTSTSWNVTYFECRVTFAPILMSFPYTVVSDHCHTGFDMANALGGDARHSLVEGPFQHSRNRSSDGPVRKPLTDRFLHEHQLLVIFHPVEGGW
jgi:hypothetical protein